MIILIRFLNLIKMTNVVRIRRSGGRIVQSHDIYIGRACYQGGWELPRSKWHNPFPISKYGSVDKV